MRALSGVVLLLLSAAPAFAQDGVTCSITGMASLKRPDEVYSRIADATGGQMHYFEKKGGTYDFDAVGNIMSATLDGDVDVLKTTLKPGAPYFSFPVDSHIKKLILNFSSDSATHVAIYDGAGQLLTRQATGIKMSEVSNGCVINLPSPAPGEWKVAVTGSLPVGFSMDVSSTLSFYDLSLQRFGVGREGTGFIDIPNEKRGDYVGQTMKTIAKLSDKSGMGERFETRTREGVAIESYPVQGECGSEAFAPAKLTYVACKAGHGVKGQYLIDGFKVPPMGTPVYAIGKDDQNQPYIRMHHF